MARKSWLWSFGAIADLVPEILGNQLAVERLDQDAARVLAALPEVQEVHHVAGEDCFLVKVRTRDTDALGALLRERVKCIPSVRATRTTIVLHTIKESATLPLDGGSHAAAT